MMEPAGAVSPVPATALAPAGYVFFGQFIGHDLVRSTPGGHGRGPAVDAVENRNSGRLDLDHLYGLEPPGEPTVAWEGARFVLGKTQPGQHPRDLRRNAIGAPLIHEVRNDENLILGQLTTLFQRFHNFVVGEIEAGRQRVGAPAADGSELRRQARRLVTWHYQWIVVHDYLPRVVNASVLGRALGAMNLPARSNAFPPPAPYQVPLEFAMAGFRFGHSTVPDLYALNAIYSGPSCATLGDVFRFTGFGKGVVAATVPPRVGLPDDRIVDWRLFLELEPPPFRGNRSLPIHTGLAAGLFQLPTGFEPRELAFRNLQRGNQLRLPTGQEVVAALRTRGELAAGATVLTEADLLAHAPDPGMLERHGFHRRTPLWYYVLKEAEVIEGGARLGPVGSHLVAPVFTECLRADPGSYLHDPAGWRPTLRGDTGSFTLADVVRNVGDIAPPWD